MTEPQLVDDVQDGGVQGTEDTEVPPLPWHVGFTTGSPLSQAAHWTVALAGGLAAAVVVLVATPDTWFRPVWMIVAAALPALAIIDARTRLLPNIIIKPVALLAVVVAIAVGGVEGDWAQLMVAGALGAGAFAVYWVIWFAAPPGGFGFGDVRLAGLLGFTLGFEGLWATFLGLMILAVPIGLAIAGLTALVQRGSGKPPVIAFGPAMILGAFIAMLHPTLFAAAVLGPMA